MSSQQAAKSVTTNSISIALRPVGVAALGATLLLWSACASVEGGVEDVQHLDDQAAAEHCELVLDQDPDDGLAYLSCSLGQPVNAAGFTAGDLAGEKTPGDDSETAYKACNTYYGLCTGANGCSRAVGEDWEFTACGSFLYAWMTICDGQAASWGTGFCLW